MDACPWYPLYHFSYPNPDPHPPSGSIALHPLPPQPPVPPKRRHLHPPLTIQDGKRRRRRRLATSNSVKNAHKAPASTLAPAAHLSDPSAYPVSDRVPRTKPGPEHDNLLSAPAACGEVIFDDRLATGADRPFTRSVLVRRSGELIGRGLLPSLAGEALPWRVQDPRGMDDYTPKAHTKKVVYRPQPTGQLKGEPELLRKEVPRSSGKIQKRPKRSLKSEPRHSTPSDRGTPDSLPDSGPIDEYRALRRQYLMLEEENFALDRELSMEDEEIKALEEEKSALLDELVVLEGLVDPSEMQPQRRL